MRTDLIHGLAATVSEKGYAASTIADIVAHARVSKRTFYQHFADKEECLMALYADACDQLMAVLRGAGSPDQPWRERVRVAVTAYLSTMESLPAVNRTLLVEMQAAGPRAYRLRQEKQRQFAEALVALVEEARPANPEIPPLSQALAIALVGGLNELLLQAIDPYGRNHRPAAPLRSLNDTVVQLVTAVLTSPPPPTT
ncbi:TetR/AcrR family transcriptional regulator [Planosporangium flavigriseum]|uniref:TetR family transcriptional regulator n=1 Tax=Planosporangium flavigriseum TaxID=373681 RepID=A0A8J3PP32_9ACTN|nr:TetR/AcrR family transcriptional regulator [Planosporangium flavigriseum]NJC67568.1 TetR/AcrR family transcriptional regulator [Planosporangium flavigriseum]GIG75979.1 TetR family transcriptional regulator [Planosporangium flavigriseum]